MSTLATEDGYMVEDIGGGVLIRRRVLAGTPVPDHYQEEGEAAASAFEPSEDVERDTRSDEELAAETGGAPQSAGHEQDEPVAGSQAAEPEDESEHEEHKARRKRT